MQIIGIIMLVIFYFSVAVVIGRGFGESWAISIRDGFISLFFVTWVVVAALLIMI